MKYILVISLIHYIKKLSFHHLINIKIINKIVYIFSSQMKSLKSGVHFMLLAHLSLD